MLSKKRRRLDPPTIHPRNKYSEKPPDFQLLASLYPSFQPFVFFSRSGRPTVDWTDFNSTRELTRVLLHHDYGVHWWIPDGQLCPTVPNRSNYIHWIGDLLSSEVIPKGSGGSDEKVRGFDIGTGANCIYPLLGASLFGWSFVGSDVTDIALEWAKTNVESNPHLQELIEIRKANDQSYSSDLTPNSKEIVKEEEGVDVAVVVKEAESLHSSSKQSCYSGPPVLVGVIRCDEKFDFCMCNPPFFESIDGAGLNPRTSCGGTLEEMVCPGGEQAFITRIIEDSVGLKTSFRWFTSMVGKKVNLKLLVSKLRQVGVSIVKTTEFVQGQTARWGLAWSFMSPHKRLIVHHGPEKSHHSFMLEGLQRQLGALQVLKAVECFFLAYGASCKSDFSSFFVNVTLSEECTGVILKENQYKCSGNASKLTSNGSDNLWCPSDESCFRIAVFEQIPGTLLVKGSLLHKENPLSGMFSSVLQCLEEALRKDFVDKFRGQFKA